MQKIIKVYCTILLFLGQVTLTCAAELKNYKRPYLLVDQQTGNILVGQDIFRAWYPASLTKMMTAYLAFKAMANGELTKNSPIILSKFAVSQAPSLSGYPQGTIVSLDTALKIMLVKSTNDLAIAIAERIAGTHAKFVIMMNEQSKQLGMEYTHFTSANGLPNRNNYSNARDLALLALALRRDFPQYTDYFGIDAIDMGKTKPVLNSNNLLGRLRGVDGMKTGYICSSGYNLVASATRKGRSLIGVVLGAHRLDIREEIMAELLERGFATYQDKQERAPNIYSYKNTHLNNNTPPNLHREFCSPEAIKLNLSYLDKDFHPILNSPFITTIRAPLKIVKVGVISKPTVKAKPNKKRPKRHVKLRHAS